MQTKLRTCEISQNNNICFPIGTILIVQKQHEKLGLQCPGCLFFSFSFMLPGTPAPTTTLPD
jgi:hypothetical protein